jgi:hypothetical protein
MVVADEFLYIHSSPTHLLSVHIADQGLLVGDIFFAHAASLRQALYFARQKFSGVSSQLLEDISSMEAEARRLIDAGQMPSLEQALPYSYCTYSVVILPPFDFTRNDGPTAVAAPNLPSPEQAKAGP